MIARPLRCLPITEHEEELWCWFLDHYTATGTRPCVDVFLRALVGAPRDR